MLISLNAMRIGLLTRFLGVLGMIVGALLVLQLPVAMIVLAFWLVMLAVLFLGKWPQQPPAWTSGEPRAVADLGRRPRGAPEGDGRPARRARARAGARARRRRGPSPSASATKRKRKRR